MNEAVAQMTVARAHSGQQTGLLTAGLQSGGRLGVEGTLLLLGGLQSTARRRRKGLPPLRSLPLWTQGRLCPRWAARG